MSHKISIYADGSSSGKITGPIGWGWVLVRNQTAISWDYGGEACGTNNTAELTAAIQGLAYVSKHPQLMDEIRRGTAFVELCCDSQYVLGMATRKFAPNINHDLVDAVAGLIETVGATTRWVRGHCGDRFNEKADKLSRLGRFWVLDNASL